MKTFNSTVRLLPLILASLLALGGASTAFGNAAEEAGAVAAAGRWKFEPARDDFDPKSLLDLRSLNDEFAGAHGFLTRTKDGNDFAFIDLFFVDIEIGFAFWTINHNRPPGLDG